MSKLRRMRTMSAQRIVLWFCIVGGTAVTNVLPVPCQTVYRLVFQDREYDSTFIPGTPRYESTLATFHPSAIARRERMGIRPVLTQLDRPFDNRHIDLLRTLGVTLGAELRWRNSILVESDAIRAMIIRRQPWVKALLPVASDLGPQTLPDCGPARYDAHNNQLDIINMLPLHDAGVFGQGASIGLIDVGFRWRDHPALAHAGVRGEWDFVQNDAVTSNQTGEHPEHDVHGTMVMSVAAAWAPGTLIGVAPQSSYILAKTEDLRFERRIEDVHYAAAVEWLERQGVDVISSSVGYHHFDSTESKWPWEAFNGRSSFSAQAVNQSVAFGVICVTAAGNSGPRDSTIITPADADSVIAVGAVTPQRITASFTSRGPTADGRPKPDILAPGAPILVAEPSEQLYKSVWGTSLATPIVAAVMAVLRSLYPNASVHEIRQAVLQTAQPTNDSSAPFPWTGVIDALAAAQRLGIAIPNVATIRSGSYHTMFIPVIGPDGTVLRAEARTTAEEAMPLICHQHDSLWWECDLSSVDAREVRFEAISGDNVVYYPHDGWLRVSSETTVPCGMRPPGVTISTVPTRLNTPTTERIVISRQRYTMTVHFHAELTNTVWRWIDVMGQRHAAVVETLEATRATVRLPSSAGLYMLEASGAHGTNVHHTILVVP